MALISRLSRKWGSAKNEGPWTRQAEEAAQTISHQVIAMGFLFARMKQTMLERPGLEPRRHQGAVFQS